MQTYRYKPASSVPESTAQANVWQLTFAAPAGVLPEVDHALRVDETVLRWVVQKRKYLERLPNTYRISKMSKLAASNDAQENSSA